MLLELNNQRSVNLFNNLTIDTDIREIIVAHGYDLLYIEYCILLSQFFNEVHIRIELDKLPLLKEGDSIDQIERNLSNIHLINNVFAIEAFIRVHKFLMKYLEILQEPYKQYLSSSGRHEDVKDILFMLLYSVSYNTSVDDIYLFVDHNIDNITRKMIKQLNPIINRREMLRHGAIDAANIRNRYQALLNYYDRSRATLMANRTSE